MAAQKRIEQPGNRHAAPTCRPWPRRSVKSKAYEMARPRGAGQRAGDPADCELPSGEEANITPMAAGTMRTKTQQHAGNRDRACTPREARVEDEIPEQHPVPVSCRRNNQCSNPMMARAER